MIKRRPETTTNIGYNKSRLKPCADKQQKGLKKSGFMLCVFKP